MKSNEQIKNAEMMAEQLKDYIEMAKVQKKLKIKENIEALDKPIEEVAVKIYEASEKL